MTYINLIHWLAGFLEISSTDFIEKTKNIRLG